MAVCTVLVVAVTIMVMMLVVFVARRHIMCHHVVAVDVRSCMRPQSIAFFCTLLADSRTETGAPPHLDRFPVIQPARCLSRPRRERACQTASDACGSDDEYLHGAIWWRSVAVPGAVFSAMASWSQRTRTSGRRSPWRKGPKPLSAMLVPC